MPDMMKDKALLQLNTFIGGTGVIIEKSGLYCKTYIELIF
jgi:hypothetical protein